MKNYSNHAATFEIGAGEKMIAAIGHCDTVPFKVNEWEHGPLSAYIDEDNNMHGRGTQDDKGPIIASFYAAKIIQDLKLPLNDKRFRLIVGCDEERNCDGIKHYLKHGETPSYSYSPDGMFPVVFNENASACYHVTLDIVPHENIVSFNGGTAINIVPSECVVELKNITNIRHEFIKFIELHGLKNSSVEKNGPDNYILRFQGKAAHACEVQEGINAITYAANFLTEILGDNAPDYIKYINECYHNSFRGQKIDLYRHDEETGETIVNLAYSKFTTKKLVLGVNIRWPHNLNFATVIDALTKFTHKYLPNSKVTTEKTSDALYVSKHNPLVENLDLVYRLITGDEKTPPISTSGGTYARKIPNCVAYGMLFPWTKDFMHQANERVNIDELLQAIKIYTLANINLALL